MRVCVCVCKCGIVGWGLGHAGRLLAQCLLVHTRAVPCNVGEAVAQQQKHQCPAEPGIPSSFPMCLSFCQRQQLPAVAPAPCRLQQRAAPSWPPSRSPGRCRTWWRQWQWELLSARPGPCPHYVSTACSASAEGVRQGLSRALGHRTYHCGVITGL